MALEKIELRNWVDTQHCGIGYTNSETGIDIPSLVLNDPNEYGMSAHVNQSRDFSTSGIYVTSFTGMGHAPVRYITSHSPNQDGEHVSDFRLEPRDITLNLRINGCDRADYWAIRAALLDAARPNWERANRLGNPILLGYETLGTVFGMGSGDRGPHQLVIHVPQADGSTVERAIDVVYRDGLSFEPDSVDDWDSFSIDETLGLTANNSFFYDPQYTEVLVENSGSGVGVEVASYYGSWHAYPIIIIEMDNSAISAADILRDIDIVITYPVEQRIRLSYSYAAYHSGSGYDTAIALDLRPSAKRAYIVDMSVPVTGFYYPIIEDITHALDLSTTGLNLDIVNFAVGPAAWGSGSVEGTYEYRLSFDANAGPNSSLPWTQASFRYHTTYIGI